ATIFQFDKVQTRLHELNKSSIPLTHPAPLKTLDAPPFQLYQVDFQLNWLNNIGLVLSFRLNNKDAQIQINLALERALEFVEIFYSLTQHLRLKFQFL